MKILVPVKRVIDPYVPVRIDQDGLGVVSENIPHAMNPFDEIALSEAALLKSELPELEIEIIAISIGPPEAKETLRTALAIGADRAIHVLCEQKLEPLALAKLLKILVDELKPDLVLMGKQSVDGDNGQTGPMLAGLLDWPQGCNASKLMIDKRQLSEGGFLYISREYALKLLSKQVDGRSSILVARETDVITMHLPALITCDLPLNQPRPVGLGAVMKAKRQPIEQRAVSDFPVDLSPRLETLRLFEPPQRPPCTFFEDAGALASHLKQKGLVE